MDGVCLTVNGVGAGPFEIALIPETLARTTLGQAGPARVNLEADVIARYVARLREFAAAGRPGGAADLARLGATAGRR